MIPEVSRRARATRWIISLHPMLEVVRGRAHQLGLGEPRLDSGPAFLPRKHFEDQAGDRIRKGHVWFIAGIGNCGFHVDFCTNGQMHIEAWQGKERRISSWISGTVSQESLKKDLALCLAAAGLTDLARTEEVRAKLFPRK